MLRRLQRFHETVSTESATVSRNGVCAKVALGSRGVVHNCVTVDSWGAILPSFMVNPDLPSDAEKQNDVPLKDELETRLSAFIVLYDDGGVMRPGGQCGCCGDGPEPISQERYEPWYIYRAGICDSEGVYYSMLCEGCLEEIRFENTKRTQTERDETAEQIAELMGDDIDGAQAFMDDLQ